ncbi:hypothetical protein L3Q67_02235 [Saccharothrix sp. AJ9571]|nr:hypothetical protein L3Q67_02235 [Saccharothrix sp. AJ9571]
MISTDTTPDTAAGRQGSWLDSTGSPGSPRRSRRRLPQLLLGALLIVMCVGGALWWSSAAHDRSAVLAMARPVMVGHVLSEADVRIVDVSFSVGVATVPAERMVAVVGRPMATSLPSGALLPPDSVGNALIPAAGRAVVAVKPGQVPPELAAGSPVAAVVAAGGAATPSEAQVPGRLWRTTVVGVIPAGTDQAPVVSLELDAVSAVQLAQVPAGQLVLVLQSAGGGR